MPLPLAGLLWPAHHDVGSAVHGHEHGTFAVAHGHPDPHHHSHTISEPLLLGGAVAHKASHLHTSAAQAASFLGEAVAHKASHLHTSATQAASFLDSPVGVPVGRGAAGRLRRTSGGTALGVAASAPDSTWTLSHTHLSRPAAGRPSALAASFLDLDQNFQKRTVAEDLADLVRSTPPAVLVPLHAASIVCAVPGHIVIELGEGFLFGFNKGVVLAVTGKSLGSLAAFGLGRSALNLSGMRERLTEKLRSWTLARQAAESVERHGLLSVFLIRIAPVPCVVKNYAPALLTEIPWSTYATASLLGLLPTTAAHAYAGTLASSFADLTSGHGAAMHAVGAVSVFASAALVSALAGWYLHAHLMNHEEEDGESGESVAVKKCQ